MRQRRARVAVRPVSGGLALGEKGVMKRVDEANLRARGVKCQTGVCCCCISISIVSNSYCIALARPSPSRTTETGAGGPENPSRLEQQLFGGWHCGGLRDSGCQPPPEARALAPPPEPSQAEHPRPGPEPPRTAAVRGMALLGTQGFRASATSRGAGGRPPPATPPGQTFQRQPATPLEQQLFGGMALRGIPGSRMAVLTE